MMSDKSVHGGRRKAVPAGDYIEARARAWNLKVEVAVYTTMVGPCKLNAVLKAPGFSD